MRRWVECVGVVPMQRIPSGSQYMIKSALSISKLLSLNYSPNGQPSLRVYASSIWSAYRRTIRTTTIPLLLATDITTLAMSRLTTRSDALTAAATKPTIIRPLEVWGLSPYSSAICLERTSGKQCPVSHGSPGNTTWVKGFRDSCCMGTLKQGWHDIDHRQLLLLLLFWSGFG